MKVVNNGLTITIDGAMGHFPKEFVVSALEKQIPKKVTHEATKLKDCTCPSCGNVISEKVDYCKHCGQALDWSEEE